MQSSKNLSKAPSKKPRSAGRKLGTAIILFLVFALLISSVPIMCYFRGASVAENDLTSRDNWAGTLDTLILGGSQVEYGLDPRIIDEEAGISSYNISCVWQNLYAERLLSEYEISRNPVKTVYLGVCLDTLTRTEDNDEGQGEIITLPRIAGLGNKLDYMFHCGQLSDLPTMYYYYMHYGFNSLVNHLKGQSDCILDYEKKGFVPYLLAQQDMSKCEGADISLEDYAVNGITDWNRENFIALVKEIRGSGAEVVVFATPLCDKFLQYTDVWDEFLGQVQSLATEAGVEAPVIDFNLYKGRSNIFEEADFYDWQHLNASGAEKFSHIFAEIISQSDAGTAVADFETVLADRFYSNYEEMFAEEYGN